MNRLDDDGAFPDGGGHLCTEPERTSPSFIASIVAVQGFPRHGVSGATIAAVRSFVRNLDDGGQGPENMGRMGPS